MKLEEVLKQVTMLPWYATREHVQSAMITNEDSHVCEADGSRTEAWNNAAYIAHACSVLPDILEKVDYVAKEVLAWRGDETPEQLLGFIQEAQEKLQHAVQLGRTVNPEDKP